MIVEIIEPRLGEQTKFLVHDSWHATLMVREVIDLAEDRDEPRVHVRVYGDPTARASRTVYHFKEDV